MSEPTPTPTPTPTQHGRWHTPTMIIEITSVPGTVGVTVASREGGLTLTLTDEEFAAQVIKALQVARHTAFMKIMGEVLDYRAHRCEVCRAPVRAAQRFCTGLSPCWKIGSGL